MNVLSCGPKASNISGISEAISPRYIRKSSQNVRACAADDGAICSKNRKIELSHIMETTPILEIARAYGRRPRLWLLISSHPTRASRIIVKD